MSDAETNEQLAQLLAKCFVQRKDVKAIQWGNGEYRPIRQPWKMKDFRDHIAGNQTYGHYTCDAEGLTKLIIFDIDLEKDGTWVKVPSDEELALIETDDQFMHSITVHQSHPRDDWRDRKHPGRGWYKYQMRAIIDTICSSVHKHMRLKTCATYSGSKGCHVYAFFDEPVQAAVARRGALYVLEMAGKILSPNYGFEAYRGKNFFKHTETDPYYNFQNFTVEIFPKQESMDGKDLGNLVRLPLGVNLRNRQDPTFFIDQREPQTRLVPHPDPVRLLTDGNPYLD